MGEWERLVCVHGIQEGLDSHSCSVCQEIAKKCGYDMSGGRTYIFTSSKQVNSELKKAMKKQLPQSKRFLDVCKEATGQEFEKLSTELKDDFEEFYLSVNFEKQNDEDFQRYFSMIQEEWSDWLSK